MNIPVNHRWGGPTTKQAMRQANRRRQRRIDWPSINWFIAGLWLGMAIAVGVMR